MHDETLEEDLLEKFCEFGEIQNCVLNLDRRTGYAKGYALVEFGKLDEAKETIKHLNGSELNGQELRVDWAFRKK